MKLITIPSLIIVILLTLVAYSVVNYWNLPEVHTNSLGQCVRVINNSGTNYNCENMPTKYINYIVKL